MTLSITLEPDPQRKRQLLERLTADLPEWFGQPGPNRAYAEAAGTLRGYVAQVDGTPRGLLLLKRHGLVSAEIYWIGVDRACHRCGIGRALVEAAAAGARMDGIAYLFVHTLHPRVRDAAYERTRLFYEAIGFQYVLEEQFPDPANPLAVYMKRL
jgi:ribosomal protein S18 acetylase RimI-like enzyme